MQQNIMIFIKSYMLGKISALLLTIIILIQFTGCYSLETVNKGRVINDIDKYLKKDIYVTTSDYYEYYFEGFKYKIENDTLYGKGRVKKWSTENLFEGKIPVQDIIEFKTKNYDPVATVGLVLGSVTLLSLTLGFLITSAFNP